MFPWKIKMHFFILLHSHEMQADKMKSIPERLMLQ